MRTVVKTSGRRGGKTEEQRRKIACVMRGHPRIVKACFGYISCARCDELLGDTLGGAYDASGAVVVGHDCEACRKTAATLTGRLCDLAEWVVGNE